MARLTVKHVAASAEQTKYLVLNVQIGRQMGATPHEIAGAMATMIQESDAVNNLQQDSYGSAGLYGQRAIYYGGYANTINPPLAIKKFYQAYLPYCKRGMDVISASNQTQHSAYPTAPAQWLSESERNVQIILGSKDFSDATAGGGMTLGGVSVSGKVGLKTKVRNLPYEFSRGSADSKETSWDCMGRLAQEVNWDRFMRGGALWFVSEQWLKRQQPRFAFAAGARGVLTIDWSADSRRNASEATVTALAKRWQVLPGDLVTVAGQGPADGNWLVSDTRRTLSDDTTTITLKRPAPKLPEPAPQTTTTTTKVGGFNVSRLHPTSIGGGSSGQQRTPTALYEACALMSSWHIPYSIAHRTLVARPPDADCSSSVSWALLKAGYPLPGGITWGGWAPVSGNFAGWGVPGEGKYFTLEFSGEHIWIRFHHAPMWRFDTSPWDCGDPNGPQLRPCARSTDTFSQCHWPGQ